VIAVAAKGQVQAILSVTPERGEQIIRPIGCGSGGPDHPHHEKSKR
jgi:hypothetical protein